MYQKIATVEKTASTFKDLFLRDKFSILTLKKGTYKLYIKIGFKGGDIKRPEDPP